MLPTHELRQSSGGAQHRDDAGDVCAVQVFRIRLQVLLSARPLARLQRPQVGQVELRINKIITCVHFTLFTDPLLLRALQAWLFRGWRATVRVEVSAGDGGHNVRVQVEHCLLVAGLRVNYRQVPGGRLLRGRTAAPAGVGHRGVAHGRDHGAGCGVRLWVPRFCSLGARLVRTSAVPSVRRLVVAKVAVEVVRQLRKAPGQLQVVVWLSARRGYILVVMVMMVMVMCLLDLREVLVHVQLSGVVEDVRYQQVLVELDASSLRPGALDFPQGNGDQVLCVKGALHPQAVHSSVPLLPQNTCFCSPVNVYVLVGGISPWFEHTVRRALHVFPVRAWIRNSHLSSPRPPVDSVQWEGGGPSVIGKAHYKPHSGCMEELSCCISQCVCMVCMA